MIIENRPMDRNRNRLELVAKLLNSETTLALATATRDGSASVAPCSSIFRKKACDCIGSRSASSEHSRNVRENPRAAVSVYRSTAEWEKIRGVQMRGAVSSAVSDRALAARSPRHIRSGSS